MLDNLSQPVAFTFATASLVAPTSTQDPNESETGPLDTQGQIAEALGQSLKVDPEENHLDDEDDLLLDAGEKQYYVIDYRHLTQIYRPCYGRVVLCNSRCSFSFSEAPPVGECNSQERAPSDQVEIIFSREGNEIKTRTGTSAERKHYVSSSGNVFSLYVSPCLIIQRLRERYRPRHLEVDRPPIILMLLFQCFPLQW